MSTIKQDFKDAVGWEGFIAGVEENNNIGEELGLIDESKPVISSEAAFEASWSVLAETYTEGELREYIRLSLHYQEAMLGFFRGVQASVSRVKMEDE